jgi:carbonic anhydrase/acetyltransferase-like protein (isoleucine patch superfamily)
MKEKLVKNMVSFLMATILLLIGGTPTILTIGLISKSSSDLVRWGVIFFAPSIFSITYLFVASTLSVPFQKAIVEGKFPRNLNHPIYGPRRLYGLCWTAIFYFTPVYYLALTVPILKKCLFRLFGYEGNLDFTIYPDTWIRDLPLLQFGQGAYIANKATLGTNLCMKSGDILVGAIKVGKRATVGHLAIVGLGSTLDDQAEIGIGVAFGLKCRIGENSKIAPHSAVNHGAQIGKNCDIGAMTYIGVKAIIGDNLVLPAASCIPAGATVTTQDEVNTFTSSESSNLNALRHRLSESYKNFDSVLEEEPKIVHGLRRRET